MISPIDIAIGGRSTGRAPWANDHPEVRYGVVAGLTAAQRRAS